MTPIVSLEADFDKDAEELWFQRDSEGTDQGGETRLRKEDWDIKTKRAREERIC